MTDRKPMVALTFDDGPSEYTPGILDELRRQGCHATFCEVGTACRKHPEALKRTAEEGHDLVNHSWDHPAMTQLDDEGLRATIADTSAIIREVTGCGVKGMRPPYGGHDQRVDAACGAQGLFVLTWTFSTNDWDHNDARKTFAAVQEKVCDGAIILCHDRSSTAEAISLMVPWLREQGYEVGSLREMLEKRGVVPAPGSLLTRVEAAQ